MNQRAELLQAVIDSPDEDGPRLALANWLEANSERERAEFIRVQCEIGRMTGNEGERLTALARREKELWDTHHASWVDDLPEWARHKVSFRRGFPTILSCTEAQWIGARGLVRRAPLRALTINSRNPSRMTAFSNAAPFTSIRALRLHRYNHPERVQAIQALSSSGWAQDLKILDLHLGAYTHTVASGDVVARALARSKLSSLECLRLGWSEVGPNGLKALVASPVVSRLRKLDLECNPIEFRGARILAESSQLESLTALSLAENRITDAGVEALANSPGLRQLTHLTLWGRDLTAASAKAVADSPSLTRLTALSLHFGKIGPLGARSLAESLNVTHLTYLNLFGNNIGDAGLQALIESPHLTRLRTLELGENALTAAGLRALARAPRMAHLERLGLCGMPGVEDAVNALRSSSRLPRLSEVAFYPNWIEQATRQEIDEHFLPLHGETLAKRL